MASNDELRDLIIAIKPMTNLHDKSNKDLQAILSALQFDQTAQKSKVEVDDKKPPYTVKMGKAIISRRGVLSDGDEVKAAYLNKDEKLGQQILNGFIKSGHIEKN